MDLHSKGRDQAGGHPVQKCTGRVGIRLGVPCTELDWNGGDQARGTLYEI